MLKQVIRYSLTFFVFLMAFSQSGCAHVPAPDLSQARFDAEINKLLAKAIRQHNENELVCRESLKKESKRFKEKVLDEYKLRQKMQEDKVSDACSLAEKTTDKEAGDICKFLRANLRTVINIGEHLDYFDYTPRAQPVLLFIYIGHELEESPNLRSVFQDENILGTVRPFGHGLIMILRKSDYSKLVNALIVLHEGKHAVEIYPRLKLTHSFTKEELAQDEVLAYEFEGRLMAKIGGAKYAALMADQIRRFNQSPAEAKTTDRVALRERQLTSIDDIFGNSGKFDRWFLWNHFYTAAKLHHIDLTIPDKKAAMAAKVSGYLKYMEEK